MSAIGGVFSRVGEPVERAILARLSRGLARMGLDGEHIWNSGPLGMLQREFHLDGNPVVAAHPILAADGYVLAFEGRLDNAPDLRRRLCVPPAAAAGHLELVLASYMRWGIRGFAEMLGDFALALWDPREQRLLLAVDSLGRRPLYYHVGPAAALWASMCRPLVDAAKLRTAVDDEFIASYLVNRPSTSAPFRGIHVVPGGHVLVVTATSDHLTRYWSFDPRLEIRYGSDEAYEEHFRSLLRESIACRLPAQGPVFSLLSGGVDSSSIVCVADQLVPRHRGSSTDLRTASFVFEQSGSSDERPYIELVEAHIGRKGFHIPEAEGPILQPIPRSFVSDHPTNWLCFLGWTDRLTREMRAHEARVLLSGTGGDQMFWSQPLPALELANLLAEGRIASVLRRSSEWSRALKLPRLQTLWRGACWPLIPRRLQALIQPPEPLERWFDGEFVRRMHLRERGLPMVDDIGFALPSQSLQYGLVRLTMRLFVLEWCSTEGYVDVRYPYLDRRMVEFALAIPIEQSVRLDETRSIVRRALRGILPEPIRRRRTKATPDEAFHRALVREWPRLSRMLDEPRIAAHGFVDPTAFRAALTRARHGMVNNHVQLHSSLSLELWLRSLEAPPAERDDKDAVPPGWRRTVQHGGDHVAQTSS